jgi:hypothetical protein
VASFQSHRSGLEVSERIGKITVGVHGRKEVEEILGRPLTYYPTGPNQELTRYTYRWKLLDWNHRPFSAQQYLELELILDRDGVVVRKKDHLEFSEGVE